MSYFSYEKELLGHIEALKAQLLARPLNLGGIAGSGGGTGGGVGYIGQLPQTRIAYDLSELETDATPTSGVVSLVDNLNHIRYRLGQLEGISVSGAGITVQQSGSLVGSNITVLDFLNADVELVEPGKVTILCPENAPVVSGEVKMAIFTHAGDLTAGGNAIRIYNVTGSSKTISKVFLSVGTAPTGAAVIVDVNKGGTTIFTTQANRPQIAATAFTGSTTTIDIPSWADGEYLTVDIDQVGSTVAGANLTIHVVYS